MVNINGNIIKSSDASLSVLNRGFNYGDSLFETVKVIKGKILFWEDHYFRLMASMRILRMEIPMSFTLEFLENEIINLITTNKLKDKNSRVKLSIYRDASGIYLPDCNDISYIITSKTLSHNSYEIKKEHYQVDLFKDYFVAANLLSNLKTNNRVINVVGSIYAKENNLNNCFLLNTNRHVIEALNGNIFLVNGTTIKTPPLPDGCIKGVMRKQIIEIVNTTDYYSLDESSISSFELQKADELFISNIIIGIQPITQYRKKSFGNNVSTELLNKLNKKLRKTN